ncbi:hypothetical protein, partial [Mailhella massiliensis]
MVSILLHILHVPDKGLQAMGKKALELRDILYRLILSPGIFQPPPRLLPGIFLRLFQLPDTVGQNAHVSPAFLRQPAYFLLEMIYGVLHISPQILQSGCKFVVQIRNGTAQRMYLPLKFGLLPSKLLLKNPFMISYFFSKIIHLKIHCADSGFCLARYLIT